MAMFNKKKDDGEPAEPAVEPTEPTPPAPEETETPPLKPFSRKGTHAPAKAPATPYRAEIPRRPVDIPGPTSRAERSRGAAAEDDPKRLVVGRDIRLKGEIDSCERLVVEGEVEVEVSGTRLIEIMSTGLFRGDVDVEQADISGRYEGNLICRNQLTVRSGGRVTGSVRYGRIVIEAGGEVCGDMRALTEEEGGHAAHAADGSASAS